MVIWIDVVFGHLTLEALRLGKLKLGQRVQESRKVQVLVRTLPKPEFPFDLENDTSVRPSRLFATL